MTTKLRPQMNDAIVLHRLVPRTLEPDLACVIALAKY
jgi:hypothetical protein